MFAFGPPAGKLLTCFVLTEFSEKSPRIIKKLIYTRFFQKGTVKTQNSQDGLKVVCGYLQP